MLTMFAYFNWVPQSYINVMQTLHDQNYRINAGNNKNISFIEKWNVFAEIILPVNIFNRFWKCQKYKGPLFENIFAEIAKF